MQAILSEPAPPAETLHKATAALGVVLVGDAIEHQPERVPLWRQHAYAVRVFQAVLTQWHAGPRGVIGLIYPEVRHAIERLRVPHRKRRACFADVQILEAEALLQLRRQAEAD